jgi:DNA-binding SARP family transcriptional activator/predicted ATPase
MEFRILGSLEVRNEGGVVPLGRSKPRAILALLLLHANEPVSAERLVVALWGAEAPPRAVNRLHVHVSRLRKSLGETASLATTPGGYLLRVAPGELDAERFERLAEAGRDALAAGEPERARALLDEALALWRGPPLADLEFEAFAQSEIARLEEQRMAAVEARVEAELAGGRHTTLIAELRHLVAANPTRERLAGQLMLALYRSGRQADALAVFRNARTRLQEELGLEPSEELRRLERQVLNQAPELDAPQRASAEAPPRSPAPSELRRVASVLRAAPVDAGLASEVDPEALHRRLDRCWDRCTRVIERHGGAVEHVAAEAIVGSFGLATVHEDDALRAVRAGAELRELAEIELRVGVATGEVFAGAGFATGEPFATASRLEAAAVAGELLIAKGTHRLVEAAIEAEPADGAWRVLDVAGTASGPRPPPATGFVGRDGERAAVRSAFARACGEPGCHLITIVGAPGIGKSRLAREVLDTIGAAATALVGRCLAYGEGITYHPLAEIVRQLGDAPGELVDERAARLVLGAVRAAGEAGSAEETFWAFRRLFEALAGEQPLVVVLDDMHWAEPTLLDLVDYVVAFSTGCPILIVCLARPELIEARASWTTPQRNRSMLALEALPSADSLMLVEGLGAGEVAAEIVGTAEGNPFFLEQLVAVHAEDEAAALPLSIRAVLAARIDRLSAGERDVLTCASVEGRSFHVGAVVESFADDGVATHLVALVRKQLIRPEPSELAGEDAFRFAHALVREAAYEDLPKQRRAVLHERVGRWLARRPGARDEIVGFHLEHACRYRSELAVGGEAEHGLADEASQRLAAAARAALVRGDPAAGARLFERATALLAAGERSRDGLLPELGNALLEAGRLADAEPVLTEAIVRGERAHDRRLEARARVQLQLLRFHAGAHVDVAAARRVARSAAAALAAEADELGQCWAWRLRAWIEWTESQAAAADDAWGKAAEHARAAANDRELREILTWRASAAVFGPTPVPEAIRRCTEFLSQLDRSPVAEAMVMRPLGLLHAMNGDFDRARRFIGKGNEVLDELGQLQSVVSHHEAVVELLAGCPEAAERHLRRGLARLEAMGERSLLATTAAMLAQALLAQDRNEEAEELCRRAERHADAEDLATHAITRSVRARVCEQRGQPDEAEALAREAVALAARTDELTDHGDALLALAAVLESRGRPEAAHAAVAEALELYERKGAVVMADRARARLQAVGERR